MSLTLADFESRSASSASGSSVNANWASPNHVHIAFLMLSTLLGTYICYILVLPFLPSSIWAIGLAVLAAPYQKRLEAKTGRAGLSALVCTVLLGLVIVIPASFAVKQLAVQASHGAAVMETKIQSGEWLQVLSSQPNVTSVIDRLGSQLDLPGIAKTLATSISSAAMFGPCGILLGPIVLTATQVLLELNKPKTGVSFDGV